MAELVAESEACHLHGGESAKAAGIDRVLSTGKLSQAISGLFSNPVDVTTGQKILLPETHFPLPGRLPVAGSGCSARHEPLTAIAVNGVARRTRRMAAHTAQGGMVILTTHQPLPGAADTVRRRARTGGGAGL